MFTRFEACGVAGASRLHVPTTSSNYCNHSPIYSKLLDDSMSSYDDPPAPSHCSAPPTRPQPPHSTAGGARYDPQSSSDHIPRLHEAHPYWVLEPGLLSAQQHHADRRPVPAASRPAPPACWRPLPTHGRILTLTPWLRVK